MHCLVTLLINIQLPTPPI